MSMRLAVVTLSLVLAPFLAFAQGGQTLAYVSPIGDVDLHAPDLPEAPDLLIKASGETPSIPDSWKTRLAQMQTTWQSLATSLRAGGTPMAGVTRIEANAFLYAVDQPDKSVLLSLGKPNGDPVTATFKIGPSRFITENQSKLNAKATEVLGVTPDQLADQLLGSDAGKQHLWATWIGKVESELGPTGHAVWYTAGHLRHLLWTERLSSADYAKRTTVATTSAPTSGTDQKPAARPSVPTGGGDRAGVSTGWILVAFLAGVVVAGALPFLQWLSRRQALAKARAGAKNNSLDLEYRFLASTLLSSLFGFGSLTLRRTDRRRTIERIALRLAAKEVETIVARESCTPARLEWYREAKVAILRPYGIKDESPDDCLKMMNLARRARTNFAADTGQEVESASFDRTSDWVAGLSKDVKAMTADLATAETHRDQWKSDKEKVDREFDDWKTRNKKFIEEERKLRSDLKSATELAQSRQSSIDRLQETEKIAVADRDKAVEIRTNLERDQKEATTRAENIERILASVRAGQRDIENKINDPAIFSIVGYLTNYSIATLFSPACTPKSNLERAMLINLWNISNSLKGRSGGFGRAVDLLQELDPSLATDASLESSRDEPEEKPHFERLLNTAKDRKQLDFKIFHIGLDRQGRIISARPA